MPKARSALPWTACVALALAGCVHEAGGGEEAAPAEHAFDLAAMTGAAVSRVQVAEPASARIHVPPGTRAWQVEGNLVAWYRESDGVLVAALEIAHAASSETESGVRIDAAPTDAGRAAAVVVISDAQGAPALQDPRGTLVLQAHDSDEVHAIAPLLSFAGSSHVAALHSPVPVQALQADRYDVRLRDASGETRYERRGLARRGGDPPVLVSGATTRPGEPVSLAIDNRGAASKQIVCAPRDTLHWAGGGQERRSFLAEAGSVTPIDPVVSEVSGSLSLAYVENAVAPGIGEAKPGAPLATGPLVVDASGVASVLVDGEIAAARVRVRGGERPVQVSHESSGSHALSRIAIAGVAAGAATLVLRDREGREQERSVTVVPVASRELEAARDQGTVRVTPIAMSGANLGDLLAGVGPLPAAAPKGPCACEKLDIGHCWVAGGVFDIPTLWGATVSGKVVNDDAGNPTIYEIQLTTCLHATLKCTKGDGSCSEKLALSAKSSDWRVDNTVGTPLPGSDSVVDSKSGKKEVPCAASCGGETEENPKPVYTVRVLKGKLPKAGGARGSSGNVGKKVSGRVRLTVSGATCAPSWSTVLAVVADVATATAKIDEAASDYDDDGIPNAQDKTKERNTSLDPTQPPRR